MAGRSGVAGRYFRHWHDVKSKSWAVSSLQSGMGIRATLTTICRDAGALLGRCSIALVTCRFIAKRWLACCAKVAAAKRLHTSICLIMNNFVLLRLFWFAAVLTLWFSVGAPVAHSIAWSGVENEAAALEAAVQNDERTSAVVVYSTIRRMEAKAAELENSISAAALITLCFVVPMLASIRQRRPEPHMAIN